jgi:hypothetical protein
MLPAYGKPPIIYRTPDKSAAVVTDTTPGGELEIMIKR